MSDVPDGVYGYRFSGFSQDPSAMETFLVGVGTLTLQGGAVTSGEHRSTFLRLRGAGAVPVHGRFLITGDFRWDAQQRRGTAALVFEQADASRDDKQTIWGEFAFVQAGPPERFWLISTGATTMQNGEGAVEPAPEVVEGELVRLADL